jgi:putative ABC transport system permease protein
MFLTVFSVALGTAILAISFSASSIIKDRIAAEMTKGGNVLYVSNATWNSDGSLSKVRPTEFDVDASSRVVSDSGVAKLASIVTTVPFNEFQANGSAYRLRSAVGTDENYFEMFGLKMASGAPMAKTEVDTGAKRVWISESMANLVFGSADKALGQQLQTQGAVFHRGPGGADSQNLLTYYAVAGVFVDPTEVARRSYGIGDLIFPYTAMMDNSNTASFMKKMMASTFAIKTTGVSAKRAEAAVRQSLAAAYGDTVHVAVWEGSPLGASTYLEQLRQAINIFSVSINILGLVLLVISSLGIFSVMVVELLGRKREIALERAIGASQAAVVREYWGYSVALSMVGAAIGVIAAAVLAGPALRTLVPLLGEVSNQINISAALNPLAALGGLLLALFCGGVLGALPAFGAVKGNIADTLREV